MQEQLKKIKENVINSLENIKDLNSLMELKNKYLSKKEKSLYYLPVLAKWILKKERLGEV